MDIAYGSEILKFTRGLVYASSTADGTGATLDMEGWDGVIMICDVATIAGGTGYLKAQQGQAANMSDAADLAGTAVPFTATGLAVLDVFRPQERYVRAIIDRDGTNAIAASLLYFQYRGAKSPFTQPATTFLERHVSPAEGTA